MTTRTRRIIATFATLGALLGAGAATAAASAAPAVAATHYYGAQPATHYYGLWLAVLFYPTLQDILGSLPPDEQAELILLGELYSISTPDNTWPGDTAQDAAT